MPPVFRPVYEANAQVIRVEGATVVIRLLADRTVRRVHLAELRHWKGPWYISNGANVEVALGAEHLDTPYDPR